MRTQAIASKPLMNRISVTLYANFSKNTPSKSPVPRVSNEPSMMPFGALSTATRYRNKLVCLRYHQLLIFNWPPLNELNVFFSFLCCFVHVCNCNSVHVDSKCCADTRVAALEAESRRVPLARTFITYVGNGISRPGRPGAVFNKLAVWCARHAKCNILIGLARAPTQWFAWRARQTASLLNTAPDVFIWLTQYQPGRPGIGLPDPGW